MPEDTQQTVMAPESVSPFFAREAARLFDRGELTEALHVCEQGRERYPWYATASLIMGRCYEELGRTAEAILEYHRILETLPDSKIARVRLDHMENRERTEFQAFVEQQEETLKKEKNSRTFEDFIREGGGESAVEFLVKKSQNPPPATASARPVTTVQENERQAEIVTVTLAEIYAAQGQFREAIAAYRKLMERRPGDAGRFGKRIVELEDLAAASESEKPLQE
jgi:tetratricopeptide (TPR) repeat protein